MTGIHEPSRATDRAGPPALGRRGGGWVAIQLVLLAAVFLSAFTGAGWPGRLAPAAYAVGGMLLAAGAALLAAGAVGLGSALTPYPAPRETGGLRTDGAYGLVRHPMYGGGVVIALGWSTVFATALGLALTVALALFADLKSRREELWLEQRFAGYAEYARTTRRRLIPFLW